MTISTVVVEIIDDFSFQVILKDHKTKVYSNVMGRSPTRLVTILPSLMAIDTVTVAI